ncbi:MAG: TRAP transporter small permease [Rhodoferax sp.]|nr:TRAP transporter small permease [Rhodoferax sp.]
MKRLLSVTESIAAVFLLAIALLTFGNVLAREMFQTQIPDWFDLSKQLQGIAIFWGIAIATYRGAHICVDLSWEWANDAGKRWIDIVATLFILAFLLPLAWMVWSKLGSTGTQTTSDLRLPLIWFYAVSAAGVTATAVLAAVRLLQLIRGTVDIALESSNG